MLRGSCLCGSVRFEIDSSLEKNDGCHCEACRKWTGHYLVSADIPRKALKITDEANLKWFASSEKVRRGFCSNCGSSLFFDPMDQEKHDWTAVALGAIDGPTGTKLGSHIFVAEKGDYYEVDG